MSAILFYTTGHGFGHAVRCQQVIRALKKAAPEIEIHVRTTAPEWLFHSAAQPISYSQATIDVGIVQEDSLEMDLGETLQLCDKLHKQIPLHLEQELDFVRQHPIALIFGDIPPLAFEIAARASIPSVAMSNFTWSWIYRGYLKKYPAFLPLIEEMERFYRKATLALTLPYPGDMGVFANQETIPWVARTSFLTKHEARAKFALPQSATIALLSFGGLGLERMPWEKLQQLRDYYFVATGKSPQRHGNLSVLPEAQRSYQDLVRAADVIIAKPGYGIVADAIAHQTRMLYTERGEFPEYPHLVQALRDLGTVEFVTQQDLLSGNIGRQLDGLLAKDRNWPKVALDGANVAAEKILRLLNGRLS